MDNQREERQRKKDFLELYHETMLRARCKRLMVEQLRSDYSSIRGIDYQNTGIPRGKGHTSDLSGMYAKIDQHQRELDATLQRAEHIFRLVKRELDALGDQKAACIISMRHISRCSWKQIAAEMGLASESRTREIYTNSLDQLIIPEGIYQKMKMGENEDEQESS